MSQEKLKKIVKDFLPNLSGLTESEISIVRNLISYSVRNSPINVEFVPYEEDETENKSNG